jgi:hypothetical protein
VKEANVMWDIGIIFCSILFFVIAGSYASGCDWLSKKDHHD